jgi:hypothetical protein
MSLGDSGVARWLEASEDRFAQPRAARDGERGCGRRTDAVLVVSRRRLLVAAAIAAVVVIAVVIA